MRKFFTPYIIFFIVIFLIAGYFIWPKITWEMEKKDMFNQASVFVKSNSMPDVKFNIRFKKRVGDWVYLQAEAINQTLDPLGIIFKKINGQWQPYNMGTSFPELEQELPQLFTE